MSKGVQATAKRWDWKRYALAGYLVLLVASHGVRVFQPEAYPRAEQQRMRLPAFDGGDVQADSVWMAYEDWAADTAEAPVLVLLHGSPMASRSMLPLAEHLRGSYRLLIPDLPGMGGSTLDVPDYSVAAHGRYLVRFLDELGIGAAHLVAYSQSGGVVLHAYDEAPDQVASLTMIAAIGVQELELLGDYHLNHAIHGLQLGFFWLLQEATPHFGYLDPMILSKSYARNFFDTDQRPLRGLLERYEKPMLILHGADDLQVPYDAGQEHARIVPQSRFVTLPGGHELPFTHPELLATPLDAFIQHVEAGVAQTRADATPARLAEAAVPFDPKSLPPAEGLTLFIVLFLIALSTLGSEDLACIGAGLLVARGTLAFLPATAAALTGILVGDILLYLAGRYLGLPAMRRAPMKWFVKAEDLDRGTQWFAQQGAKIVIASRFLPGTRLPTYVTAGVLRMPFLKFLGYFLAATVLWTPLLVGAAVLLGEVAFDLIEQFQAWAVPVLVGVGVLFWLILKVGVPATTHRGRRLLLSRWRRWTRWEFWPPWLFYLPLLPYLAGLALKHRSLTVFTAANPAIPDGGWVGESKAQILGQLAEAACNHLARFALIQPDTNLASRLAQVEVFMEVHELTFPIVLKPDVGERGKGVQVIRSLEAAEAYLRTTREAVIVQQYAPGAEYGVFYYRYPNEDIGRIFSITDKHFPQVYGDGTHTLERLILDDERTVCMAPFYLRLHSDHILTIPADGETVQLVELGTHCRGAVFLDGAALNTPALAAAIDRISQGFDGFYFGRYDLRTPSPEDFAEGRNFKIIELNGVTSEATHIYDPTNRLRDAYRTLRHQWRVAFEIGAMNHAAGTPVPSVWHLLRQVARFKLDRE